MYSNLTQTGIASNTKFLRFKSRNIFIGLFYSNRYYSYITYDFHYLFYIRFNILTKILTLSLIIFINKSPAYYILIYF